MTPSKDFIKKHLLDTLTGIETLFDTSKIYRGKVRDTFKIDNKSPTKPTYAKSEFFVILSYTKTQIHRHQAS